MPEFYDINVMRNVLSLIEEAGLLEEIFAFGANENPIRVVYGSEMGNKYLEPVGLVYMTVQTHHLNCTFGVLGSARFDYPYVIPMMRYVRGLVLELVDGDS
jgi:transcriptional regulator of heat shock response